MNRKCLAWVCCTLSGSDQVQTNIQFKQGGTVDEEKRRGSKRNHNMRQRTRSRFDEAVAQKLPRAFLRAVLKAEVQSGNLPSPEPITGVTFLQDVSSGNTQVLSSTKISHHRRTFHVDSLQIKDDR